VFIFVVIGVVLLSVVGDFANNLTREGVEAEFVSYELGDTVFISNDMTWLIDDPNQYYESALTNLESENYLVIVFFSDQGFIQIQFDIFSNDNIEIYEPSLTNEYDFSVPNSGIGFYEIEETTEPLFFRDNTLAIKGGQFHDTTIGTLITLLPVLYIIILVSGAVGYVVISKKN
jgi:hypothetical protein